MNDETKPTPYEAAVKRIADVLETQYAQALHDANATLGDGKHGTIAPAIRDFAQEARDLFEASLAVIVESHVLNKLYRYDDCMSAPLPPRQPVPPPPGPWPR